MEPVRAFQRAVAADVPNMRLALGIAAAGWLLPLVALADDPPTSPDVPSDECGPSDPVAPGLHRVPRPLEVRIARLEAQLAMFEATSEAALTAASSAEAARSPMFGIYGFIETGLGMRVGQFLTPYGIWNVDQGMPMLILLYRPFLRASEMFPEHRLGVAKP